jgi:hypothetical protein
VRDGEGGATVAAPIKQKNQNQNQKSKQNRMKHALLNATNANSAAQSHATTTARCIQTLTAEKQCFQMRKMNQR